jgi:hypothetical protein
MAVQCKYTHESFSRSDIFNPFNQETHAHDGTDQCWIEGDDVIKFLSPNGQGRKGYCLFHVHHAPKGWTQTRGDTASLGGQQSTRLKELLDQWNAENAKRKSNNETLLTFALPGMQCGSVDFKDYTFSHDLDFRGATFSDFARFTSTTFGGVARFENATFNDSTWFDKATFNDFTWFDKAKFSGSARFDNATFSDSAWFDNATFSDNAEFYNATFSDSAWFNNATFSGSFSFNDTTCSGAVTFSMNLFSNDVSFKDSKFHGDMSFHLAKMEKGGRFVNCLFDSFTYQTHIGERLLFNHCKTEKELIVIDQDCSRLAFLNMDLTKADFLGADVSKTRFDACPWKERGGPKYATVYKHSEYLENPTNEDYQDRVSKLKALYRQLMKNLEENREYKQAGDFHYQEMALRQKMLADGLADSESWFERPMLWLYRVVGDFGENYVKLGGWLVASWLASACLIWSYNLDKTYTHILGIVVTAIIPGWPKSPAIAEFNEFCTTILISEAVVTLILAALFAMAVNRRYKR